MKVFKISDEWQQKFILTSGGQLRFAHEEKKRLMRDDRAKILKIKHHVKRLTDIQ